VKDSARVLVALVAALGIGVAIAAWGGPGAVAAADFVAPLGALWITAIRMTVIPLVVSLLVTGVASASDVKAIGRLGGRALLVFVLLLVVMCAVFIPLAPVIFGLLPQGAARPPLPAGAAEAAGQIAGGEGQTLAAWIGSLLPPNPIAAAAAGQMVPLILFTLLLALAIAKSAPASRATLVGFFTALGEAMMRLVTWVIAAAPVGVFALVLPLAAHAGAAVAGAMGFYVAAYSLGCIAGILLLYPLVRLLGGVPMGKFARAALPPQLIAFSSSSSIATLPALVDASERLGLGKRIGGFVLPLAVSIFHVSGPVTWSFGALFVSWFYGVPLHARELLMIAAYSTFLGFAGPGVPRGGFIMLAPLFLALGLPVEGIGILIAVDALPDTFSTVYNVTGDLAAATIVGRRETAETAVPAEPAPLAAR